MIAQDLWADAWKVCVGDKDLTNARTGGRATKARPNKEDVSVWHEQGPAWVADYMQWRTSNPQWKIWTAPDGNPAIELMLNPVVGGVTVKMAIDRIFEVDGQLVIVDLKTSQQEPSSALQLGFYKIGIEQTFGIDVKWGTYYMSRKSSMGTMIDLSWYTLEKLEYLVQQFDKSRKAGIFLPNAENCNMCGFTKQCQFTSKKADQ